MSPKFLRKYSLSVARQLPGGGIADTGDVRIVKTFANSEFVRRWLVLLALDAHASGAYMTDPRKLSRAFARVVGAVKRQRIALDYVPPNRARFELPPIHHPLRLQAIVYWCCRFDCDMFALAEVHALLGSSPPVRDTLAALAQVREGEHSGKGWASTLKGRPDSPPTVPMHFVPHGSSGSGG